jgi:hypothetical protein
MSVLVIGKFKGDTAKFQQALAAAPYRAVWRERLVALLCQQTRPPRRGRTTTM